MSQAGTSIKSIRTKEYQKIATNGLSERMPLASENIFNGDNDVLTYYVLRAIQDRTETPEAILDKVLEKYRELKKQHTDLQMAVVGWTPLKVEATP